MDSFHVTMLVTGRECDQEPGVGPIRIVDARLMAVVVIIIGRVGLCKLLWLVTIE